MSKRVTNALLASAVLLLVTAASGCFHPRPHLRPHHPPGLVKKKAIRIVAPVPRPMRR